MGRIQIYNPAQKASSLTGVPQMDNSGAMLADAIAGSTNALAGTANAAAAQQQARTLAASRESLVALGYQLRQAQKRQAMADAQQQAYLDAGSAQDVSSNATMDLRALADKIQTENPNDPSKWAGMFRDQSEAMTTSAMQGLNAEATKLATPSIYNARESNFARLTEAGRSAQEKLNETRAMNTVNRFVANGSVAGARNDTQLLVSDVAEIHKQAEVLKLTTPAEEVDSKMIPQLKQYVSNFIESRSISEPGSIDRTFATPELQGLIKLFTPKELESKRAFDKERVEQYFTAQSIDQRSVSLQNDVFLMTAFSKVDRDFYNPDYTPEQRRAVMVDYMQRARAAQNELDRQITAGDWDGVVNQKAGTELSEKLSKQLAKIGKHIETLDNAQAAAEHTKQIKALAESVSGDRVDLRAEWNSDAAQAYRVQERRLWQASRVRQDMSLAEKSAAADAATKWLTLVQKTQADHPNWLAEPSVDARGKQRPGDLSYVAERTGVMLDRLDALRSQPGSGRGLDKLLEKFGLKKQIDQQSADIKFAPLPAQFYESVGAKSEPQRSQVDQALTKELNRRFEIMRANGIDPSPAKQQQIRSLLMQPENRSGWVPKVGPPLLPKSSGKVAKTKSGLVPPPPPDIPSILPEEYYSRSKGRNVP